MELHAEVAPIVDRFFSAWNERDPFLRRKRLGQITHERIEFYDAFAAIRGAQDLDEHIAAVHMFMAGTTLERCSDPRRCQGCVLVDWIVRRNGEPTGHGTNFFELTAAGQISRVVGFRVELNSGRYERLARSNQWLRITIQCRTGDTDIRHAYSQQQMRDF